MFFQHKNELAALVLPAVGEKGLLLKQSQGYGGFLNFNKETIGSINASCLHVRWACLHMYLDINDMFDNVLHMFMYVYIYVCVCVLFIHIYIYT